MQAVVFHLRLQPLSRLLRLRIVACGGGGGGGGSAALRRLHLLRVRAPVVVEVQEQRRVGPALAPAARGSGQQRPELPVLLAHLKRMAIMLLFVF